MKSARIIIISYTRACINVVAKTLAGISMLVAMFFAFYWYNNRLFLWEASLLWTQVPFSEARFKTGSTEDRAQMSVDLIRSKKIIGIESNRIPALLGDPTGDYYQNDSNITYRLTERGSADWVLTLVPGDDGKIETIFIRKSCCSITKKILPFGLDLADPLFKKLISRFPVDDAKSN